MKLFFLIPIISLIYSQQIIALENSPQEGVVKSIQVGPTKKNKGLVERTKKLDLLNFNKMLSEKEFGVISSGGAHPAPRSIALVFHDIDPKEVKSTFPYYNDLKTIQNIIGGEMAKGGVINYIQGTLTLDTKLSLVICTHLADLNTSVHLPSTIFNVMNSLKKATSEKIRAVEGQNCNIDEIKKNYEENQW